MIRFLKTGFAVGALAFGLVLLLIWFKNREDSPQTRPSRTDGFGSAEESPQTKNLVRPTKTEGETNLEPPEEDPPGSFFLREEKWTGLGTIKLRLVDDLTGEPIPELRFALFSERPRDHLIGRGRSDESGEALLEFLPEDLILVETERKPPYSATVDGLWLSDATTVEHELRVRRGARVNGRVVDERGTPVSGARITISNPSRYALPPDDSRWIQGNDRIFIQETGPNGRFEVDHVLSRPNGIWVVDGELRPESWYGPRIWADKDRQQVNQSIPLDDGETGELDDLVIPQAVVLKGRVVDATDRGLEGVLVSLVRNMSRATALFYKQRPRSQLSFGPDSPGFELQEGEAWSGANGQFELFLAGENWITAILSETEYQSFTIPRTSVEAPVEEMILKMESLRSFHFELLSQGGKRITQEDLSLQRERIQNAGRMSFERSSFRVRSNLLLTNGDRRSIDLTALEDGTWSTPRCEVALNELQAIEIYTPGNYPSRLESSNFPSEGPFPFLLEPLPYVPLKLRCRLDPPPKEGERHGLSFRLRACLVDKSGTPWDAPCCGLGAELAFFGKEKTLELLVAHPGPFWIHATPHRRADDGELPQFGPFRTGDEVHEIALARYETTAKPQNDPVPKKEKVPPPPSTPHDPPPRNAERGSLLATFIDAKTGAPIEDETVQVNTVEDRYLGYLHEKDSIWTSFLNPGPYQVQFIAWGYERTVPYSIEISPESKLELGEITLKPKGKYRVRILDSGGSPIGPYSQVRARTHGSIQSTYYRHSEDGIVELIETDTDSQILFLSLSTWTRRDRPQYLGAQEIVVEPSTDVDEIPTYRLAPVRDLELRIHGIAPEHTLGPLQVDVYDVSIDDGMPLPINRRVHAGPEGFLYRAKLGAKRYSVKVTSGLYDFEPTSVDLTGSSAIYRAEVHAR